MPTQNAESDERVVRRVMLGLLFGAVSFGAAGGYLLLRELPPPRPLPFVEIPWTANFSGLKQCGCWINPISFEAFKWIVARTKATPVVTVANTEDLIINYCVKVEPGVCFSAQNRYDNDGFPPGVAVERLSRQRGGGIVAMPERSDLPWICLFVAGLLLCAAVFVWMLIRAFDKHREETLARGRRSS